MVRMEMVEKFSDSESTVKVTVVIHAGGSAKLSNLNGLRKTEVGTFIDDSILFEGPIGKRLYIEPKANDGFHLASKVKRCWIIKEPGEYIIDVDFDVNHVVPDGYINAFDRDPKDSVSNADILAPVLAIKETLEKLL